MTVKTASVVAALLSIACGSVVSAQSRKGEAVALPMSKPAPPKTVIGKCARTYSTGSGGAVPAEVQALLPAPLVGSALNYRRDWVFYASGASSFVSSAGPRTDVYCQYKSASPPVEYLNIYSFGCKNAIKQAEDTWSCEV